MPYIQEVDVWGKINLPTAFGLSLHIEVLHIVGSTLFYVL